MANHLPIERKIQIIDGLCNGLSLRGASRVFSTHRTAVMRLLVRVGDRCETLLEEQMRSLSPRYLELGEPPRGMRPALRLLQLRVAGADARRADPGDGCGRRFEALGCR